MSEPKVQYLVDDRGKKTGVVLPYMRYRQMLEDIHDLGVIAERRNEKPISMAEMKRRLRRKGRV